MSKDVKEIRELRRLLRDLVALATTPAVWVGRDRGQIAEGVADVLLHTLRADAIYVRLQSANKIEAVRSAQHPGFSDEVRRLWQQPAVASLQVDTVIASTWPNALRVATQSIGISGDDGFIVVGCADPAFPNESQALLLSVAANQAAVALQAASLRAQAELERHRLQDLLAKAPAAIGLLSGPEHRWIFVNENYIRVTGRNSAADFVGKTLRESLPEIETQPFIELLDGVYRTGESYVGREMKAKLNRAQSGQPEEGYFDFVYEPLRNSEGVVDGIFVHAVEVTNKVLARQEVEKRERQFREMIDALPAAIYTTDAEGRLTHFNPAAVEFSGRKPELGTDQWCISWKLFYPDGRPMPHDECPMAIALKEGRAIEGAEAIAERPDGTQRWFTPYPTLLRDDRGNIVGGINMLVDITARKQAEEATGYLAAIVSSSDDAILSKNLDGVIRSWNKSAERLFGYSAKEAIGKHITIIVPSDRRTEENNILSRLRRGERIDHFETLRMRKDGTTFDVSLTISPIKDSAGRVIGASNVARDISHLKRIERALRDSEERYRTLAETLEAEVRARTRELEERNNEILRQTEQVRELSWRLLRAQDEERRHIARELHDSAGQTLTVLGMNLAQFVQKTGRAAPEVAREAETIQEMVQQLHRDIRTTSYLLHPPLLDESGLYSALSWYTQGLVERSGLQIRLDMSEDFGRLPRDMELAVFRLIQECLTNIHRHSGSKLASIRVVRESDQVAVEVRDQGAGMSSERLAQIQSGASGVGIRGMRERLRQFKGELKIESDNSGTRIWVTIPVLKNAIAQDESSHESLQAAI
jgi:PAS domain S-box-containing protein